MSETRTAGLPSTSDEQGAQSVRGPLAFFGDVHGNRAALEAVLAACAEAGAGMYFAAGDLLLHGDDPLGVWLRLQELGARCVRGTSDVALAALDPAKLRAETAGEREALARFEWTRRALGELILARVRKLPDVVRVELADGSEIVVTYGSPKDPTEPFSYDQTDDEVRALLGDDEADVVVCGGADVPFVREVDGVRVIGLGSVGDAPRGERVAHFALVLPGGDEGVQIEPRWVRW